MAYGKPMGSAASGGGAGKKRKGKISSQYKPLAGKPGKGKMKTSAKKPGGPGSITKPVRPIVRPIKRGR